jgi:hypothetical protein
MYHFVEHSKTDNGEAVSILLQHGRCDVDVAMLEKLLRKGYTAMAAVLQQDERVVHSTDSNVPYYLLDQYRMLRVYQFG